MRQDQSGQKKAKNKANREMRNMRSDEDLSHYGSGIGQKSKPTFTVSSSVSHPASYAVNSGTTDGKPAIRLDLETRSTRSADCERPGMREYGVRKCGVRSATHGTESELSDCDWPR